MSKRLTSDMEPFRVLLPGGGPVVHAKARGINQDIFDSLDYWIPVSGLNGANFSERLQILLNNQTEIRTRLASRIPKLQAKALDAGPLLRKILEAKDTKN